MYLYACPPEPSALEYVRFQQFTTYLDGNDANRRIAADPIDPHPKTPILTFFFLLEVLRRSIAPDIEIAENEANISLSLSLSLSLSHLGLYRVRIFGIL